MADFVITTSRKPGSGQRERAVAAAAELEAPFVSRMGRSIKRLCADEGAEGVLVIEGEREVYYQPKDDLEFFFHPNMAPMRIRNLRGGGRDHLIEAMKLGEGDELLDCTLGFAAEAILCAHIVGDTGRVVGLEKIPVIAYMTGRGLQCGEFVSKEFTEAMRRIEVHRADYNEYLPECADGAFDVVYFDPIFDQPLAGSESMAPLRVVADSSDVGADAVEEARRVARRCVVIKQRAGASKWQELSVTEIHGGSNSRVAYGVVPALGG